MEPAGAASPRSVTLQRRSLPNTPLVRLLFMHLGPAGLDVLPESHYSAPLHERAAGAGRGMRRPINTVTICPL